MAQKQLVLSCTAEHRVAEAIAAELDLAFMPCAHHGLALAADILRHARRSAVLVLPEGSHAAWLYRLLSRGRVLLVGQSRQSLIIRQDRRTTLLTSVPDEADLSLWVNRELLPAMGFVPLATAYGRE